MKSFLILKVYETDLKGAWVEKWKVDIVCVKYLLGNDPWRIYSFFLSDYTKIHSRRPNFFAAAIIFIKWNLKERKRGNCTVWKNWFKIWQVFGLWIFISQFSSNIIEIYVIWEFKESLYRYIYLVKICPIFGTDYAQTDLEGMQPLAKGPPERFTCHVQWTFSQNRLFYGMVKSILYDNFPKI